MPFNLEQMDVAAILQDNPEIGSMNTISMKDFELLRVLGTGAYGKVYLTRKVTGEDCNKLYAMKVLKKTTVTRKPKTKEHTITERKILESIRNSPFLMNLHYAFQTNSKLHLILDYVNGGELFMHLYRREKFNDEETKFYIGEIAVALDILHKLDVIYRDLKLENILLDREGHIVLTDFGLSKELQKNDNGKAYSFCGTVEYMSPELIRGHGHDFRIDWWSLGILTFELLSGASPFTIQGQDNSHSNVTRRILEYEVPMPPYFSDVAGDFISCMLKKDPDQRMLFGDIRLHAYYEDIDWSQLESKQLAPPIVPRIHSDVDTSNFSSEFTSMTARDSPAITPGDNLFRGYSFVSPSVMFGNNNVFTLSSSDDEIEHAHHAHLPATPTSLSNTPPNTGASDGSKLTVSFKSHYHSPFEKTLWVASRLTESTFFQQYTIKANDPILGDGTFSVCRCCTRIKTGEQFAVKIISKRYDASREISTLTRVQGHRNIVTLVEVHNDSLHTYIVMDLLKGGELLTAIKRRKSFSETEASKILRDIVSAVEFLHANKVIHRDLKPENLIFQSDSIDSCIKIVDFGFAQYINKNGLTTPCYTLPYVAPEVLGRGERYDESCDLWSLGVIMFTMLTGRVPFQSGDDVVERIKRGEFSLETDDWKHISDEAKKLIRGLLTVNTKERYTMQQVIDSDWLCMNSDYDDVESEPSVLKRKRLNTPLLTPKILRKRSSMSMVSEQITLTLKAFHDAHRQGFRLQEVIRAPLAQRRRAHRDANKDCPCPSPKDMTHDDMTHNSSPSVELESNASQGFDVSLFEYDLNSLKRSIRDVL